MKTILVDAVYTFVSDAGVINQELYKLLESYETKKIILTNAPYSKFEQFGLTKVPYDVFTLEHNPNKRETSYFIKMLGHFNLKVEDVVYFEHNKEAVESASSLDIITHHFDKEKKDLVALKEFLDKNL